MNAGKFSCVVFAHAAWAIAQGREDGPLEGRNYRRRGWTTRLAAADFDREGIADVAPADKSGESVHLTCSRVGGWPGQLKTARADTGGLSCAGISAVRGARTRRR